MIKYFNISFISLIVKFLFLIYILIFYIWFFKIKKFPRFKKILYFFFVNLFIGINFLIYIHINIQNHIENIKTGNFYKIPNITLIKNTDGNIVGRIGVENRQYESLNNIPNKILHTIISVEDESFFSNYGISFKNTIFNFFKAIFTNKKITGASTITQQLSRNLFLSKKISIIRKIKEMYLSFYLSFYYSKDQILEMYVNYIYFGDNCYGIKSSSKHFFHKNLQELNNEEIAFLVALVKGPSYYLKNLNLAIERKNYVLSRMLKTNIINEEEYNLSKNNPINLKNKQSLYNNETYFYVVEEIKEWMKDNNLDPEDGYIIEINIKDDLQKVSTGALQEVLNKAEDNMVWKGPIAPISKKPLKDFNYLKNNNNKVVYLDKNGHIWNDDFSGEISNKDYNKYINIISKFNKPMVVLIKEYNNEWYLKNPPKLNGCGVVINIHTGEILSTVGGRGYNYSFINGTTQVIKSPGSIGKIITTTAAFEAGFTPEYELPDIPIYVDNNGNIFFINEEEVNEYLEKEEALKIKVIKNYDKKYMGLMNLKTAMWQARNIPLILLIKELGINKVKNMAVEMGIVNSSTPFYLSSTLGSIYVNIRNMANGIASIGNGGYKLEKLHLVKKVIDLNGNIVYEMPEDLIEKRKKILTDNTVAYSNDIFNSVTKYGIKNKLNNINKKLCCKTGTAQGNREASFVVWDRNYLIYFMVYNMDPDENLINNDFLYELWGRDLPLNISKNILNYLNVFLEDALYLNSGKPQEENN